MATQQPGPGQTQAVAKTQKDIQQLLESAQFKKAVASALPKHITPDRFVRIALTAMMRTPKLRECTQESLFKCLLDLSMYGLEPDGRRAHLIPYKRNYKDGAGKWQHVMEAQLIIDYKGLAELVRRSGDVSYIHADVVCEGDEFDYSFGSGAFLKHKPTLEGDRAPETVKCIYSFVKFKDGSEDFIVLSRGEVNKVRDRSKSKDEGPWVTDWSAMAMKTAFRRHSKWLPLSPEVRDAIEADDDAIDIKRTVETPDGDTAWLEVGSIAAAEAVAETKIAQMEAERQRKGYMLGESDAERENRQEEQFKKELETAKTAEAERVAELEKQAADTKRSEEAKAPVQFESWEAWEKAGNPVHPNIIVLNDPQAGTFNWNDEASTYKPAQAKAEEAPKSGRPSKPVFGRKG